MGKTVTFKEKEREITLLFPDRIMFENIESICDDINEICSNSTHDKLIMDFAGVNYISSAGLHVFLEFTKHQESYNLSMFLRKPMKFLRNQIYVLFSYAVLAYTQ